MKKFIKSTLLVIGATLATLLFTNLFINAWDNTMTDEEIVYYLEKYPTEEKLIKLAERRNLIEKVEWSHFSKKNLRISAEILKTAKSFFKKKGSTNLPFYYFFYYCISLKVNFEELGYEFEVKDTILADLTMKVATDKISEEECRKIIRKYIN